MDQNKINSMLNFLKFFACLGVVFIHVLFPGIFGQIISYGSSFAVPFFFMIAGYYAWKKDEKIIKRRLFKIIKILVIAYMLYFIFFLVLEMVNGQDILTWIHHHFNWKTPIKNICFCYIDFAPSLWYLIAMIETYILWYFIVKYHKEQSLIKTLLILFIFQIILTSICETLALKWFWKFNFIAQALPWFMLGYYLHSDKAERIRNIKSYQLIILVIIGCGIAVSHAIIKMPFKFSVIGYIPYTFGLFTLALKYPNKSVNKVLEYIGANLSLYIYIIHIPIAMLFGIICSSIWGSNLSMLFWWCRPSIIFICSLFVSFVIYKIIAVFKTTFKSHS